ncbi:hypothetical protein D3C87_2110540 [compost metagenome]
MHEPEEVETPRQHLAVLVLGRLRLVTEIDHGGLIRVKLQPVFPKPLTQHLQHPLRVILVCTQHDKIVRKAD